MKRAVASRVVTGLAIVAVGILVLGQVAGLWDVGDLSKSWWTLFIIIPGIASIASSGLRFWNVFLVLLGAWLLVEDQGWLDRDTWPYFAGVFLVFLGIYIIAGGTWRSRHRAINFDTGKFNQDNSDFPEYNCVFADQKYSNNSQTLRGGKASNVFGGLTLDLREIGITGNAYFEVSSVFGNMEILAPRNVPLKIVVTPVFGAFYNDAAYTPPKIGQPYLEIKGSAVFGSIRVL